MALTTVRYRNIPFRIIIAILASYYVLVHGRGLDWISRVMKLPMFYVAWAISFIITFGLLYLIHFFTVQLDKKLDWREQPGKRIAQQALKGIGIPLVLEPAMLYVYSLVVGEHFSLSEFIETDAIMVILFFAVYNAYYAVHYLILTASKKHLEAVENESDNPPNNVQNLKVYYGPNIVYLNVTEDILYFNRSGSSLLKVVTKDKEFTMGKRAVTEMEETYGKLGFCQINRQTVINMRIVEGFTSATTRNNLKINFHDPSIMPDPNSVKLLVKKEFSEKFIEILSTRS